MSLKDLMYRDRVDKDYSLPRELASLPPASQAMPTIQPLPPIEDVEDFAPEFEVRETETTQTIGQPALEIWALESQRIREGRDVPAIHRHANKVLRETQSQDVTCPHCGLIFQP